MAEGTPLHGDRGAWNVVDFDTEHAKDIDDGALTRHLPAPGTAGHVAVDDGTHWQSQALGGSLTIYYTPVITGAIVCCDNKVVCIDNEVVYI